MKNEASSPSPADNTRAQAFLASIADELRKRIRKIRPLALVTDSVHHTDTGGYRIALARAKRMRVEIWFDMYARYPKRHLWYGYYWNGKNNFNGSFGHWRDDNYHPFTVGGADNSEVGLLLLSLGAVLYGKKLPDSFGQEADWLPSL